MKFILYLIVLPLLILSETTDSLSLQEIKNLISKADSAKVWTLHHTAPDAYNQHYISSLPSYSHRADEQKQPDIIEKEIQVLSQSDCQLLAATFTDYEKHRHNQKLCGDWEARGFCCEFILDNGYIANVRYSLNYSALHCGVIFITDRSGELKQSIPFTTRKSRVKKLLSLFSDFVAQDCYGQSDCMNGYCFSFKKPGLVLRMESWEKIANGTDDSEVQRKFTKILLPQLNHLNSFDKKTLSSYRDVDTLDSGNSIQRLIVNLREEAAALQCKLLWSDVKMAFYFEVPESIKPVYDSEP